MAPLKLAYTYDAERNANISASDPPRTSLNPNLKAFLNLDPIVRMEVSRFLKPTGPLEWVEIGSDAIRLASYIPRPDPIPHKGSPSKRELSPVEAEAPRPPYYQLFEALAGQCKSLNRPCPALPSREFWMNYESYLKQDTERQVQNQGMPILRASLTSVNDATSFKLEPPTWGISCRVYRRFRPESFIRVSVPKSFNYMQGGAMKPRLREFLLRDFVRFLDSNGLPILTWT
jgi:hypothetical protein